MTEQLVSLCDNDHLSFILIRMLIHNNNNNDHDKCVHCAQAQECASTANLKGDMQCVAVAKKVLQEQ